MRGCRGCSFREKELQSLDSSAGRPAKYTARGQIKKRTVCRIEGYDCIHDKGQLLIMVQKTLVSPFTFVFFITVLEPLYVLSRHFCSAVHIL